MIETITFNNQVYPTFQSTGFASRFIFPFAQEVCKGWGYDIGCSKKEWSFPGSIPIDIVFNSKADSYYDNFDAYKLPPNCVPDYIFSSHCLEHLPDWVGALDYWLSIIKTGGVILLYLPHYSQEYWKPWNNRKHIHALDPNVIRDYFIDRGVNKIFVSGVDLNCSFSVLIEK